MFFQGVRLCFVIHTLLDNGIDTLTDNRHYIQAPFPHATNVLESYLDEKTVLLLYYFHHGDAMKGANRDQ